MVGPAGNDPACPGFQPGANPSQLETHARKPGVEPGLSSPPGWRVSRLPRFRRVGSRGVEPRVSAPRTRRITVFLEPVERRVVPARAPRCRAPARHVEKVGIEPTASMLARRDRCLSCHPRPAVTRNSGRPRWARGRMWGRRPVRPRQPGRSWSRTTRNQITGTASTRPRDTMRWRGWNWRGLNPRPLRCERSALPSELQPRCLGCPGSRRGTPGWQAVTSACRCVRVQACSASCSRCGVVNARARSPGGGARRDGQSRTVIPPVLETGSQAAGSSLCGLKCAT